jgi:hypothetical protein
MSELDASTPVAPAWRNGIALLYYNSTGGDIMPNIFYQLRNVIQGVTLPGIFVQERYLLWVLVIQDLQKRGIYLLSILAST